MRGWRGFIVLVRAAVPNAHHEFDRPFHRGRTGIVCGAPAPAARGQAGPVRARHGRIRDRHQRVRDHGADARDRARAGHRRAAGRPRDQRVRAGRGGRRAAAGDPRRAAAAAHAAAGADGVLRAGQPRQRAVSGLPRDAAVPVHRRTAARRVLRRGGAGGRVDQPARAERPGGGPGDARPVDRAAGRQSAGDVARAGARMAPRVRPGRADCAADGGDGRAVAAARSRRAAPGPDPRAARLQPQAGVARAGNRRDRLRRHVLRLQLTRADHDPGDRPDRIVDPFWPGRVLRGSVGAGCGLRIPDRPPPDSTLARRDFNLRPVLLALCSGAIGFAGMFFVFSYLAPTMTQVTGLPESWIPFGLVAFGVGSIIGTLGGGWLYDRLGFRSVAVVLAWSVVVLLVFPLAAQAAWSLLVVVVAVGTMGALATILQADRKSTRLNSSH